MHTVGSTCDSDPPHFVNNLNTQSEAYIEIQKSFFLSLDFVQLMSVRRNGNK